ncbi:MAG: magnesium chelatase domain-containing protein, partial [Gammaproteobacteria bacterium]
MSLATVLSRAQNGLKAPRVRVEVHVSGGLPAFTIVGLAETAVRESRDRVRAAIQNAGLEFPQRRITVNLAPADFPKEGGRFDLAIAVGILSATAQLPADSASEIEFYGELSLGGELRRVPGLFPALLHSRRDDRRLIVPHDNSAEAALVPGIEVGVAQHLLDVCRTLSGG